MCLPQVILNLICEYLDREYLLGIYRIDKLRVCIPQAFFSAPINYCHMCRQYNEVQLIKLVQAKHKIKVFVISRFCPTWYCYFSKEKKLMYRYVNARRLNSY